LLISTKEQYNRLKYINQNFLECKFYNSVFMDSYFFSNLTIVNDFLNEQLLNEKDEIFIKSFFHNNINIFLLYLYKFKYISSYVLNLFYIKPILNHTYMLFDTIEYIYYNNREYLDNSLIKSNINEYYFGNIFKNFFYFKCVNIQLLDYFVDVVKKYSIVLESKKYRIPPRFPLNIIEKYTNKIYKPNSLYVHCENNYIERFINSIFSDTLINKLSKYEIFNISDELNVYEIYEDMLELEYKIIHISNNNNKFIENNTKRIKYDYLDTKDIIMKKYDLDGFRSIKSYNNINYDNIDITIIEKIKELPFVKKYLGNYNEINKILNNPEFIVNINFETKSNVEYIIMKFTYIISLIHNKTKDFIIYVLLNYYNQFNINYKNHKLYIEINDYQNKEFLNIFKVLSSTPHEDFNKYIYYIIREHDNY